MMNVVILMINGHLIHINLNCALVNFTI